MVVRKMRSSKYGSVMTDSMAEIASVTFNLPVIEISEKAVGESNLEDEIEQQKDRSRCDQRYQPCQPQAPFTPHDTHNVNNGYQSQTEFYKFHELVLPKVSLD
jgi:hypothetical protein